MAMDILAQSTFYWHHHSPGATYVAAEPEYFNNHGKASTSGLDWVAHLPIVDDYFPRCLDIGVVRCIHGNPGKHLYPSCWEARTVVIRWFRGFLRGRTHDAFVCLRQHNSQPRLLYRDDSWIDHVVRLVLPTAVLRSGTRL